MRLKSLFLPAFVLFLPGVAGAYTFVNIDNPDADWTEARGINNNGVIVGSYGLGGTRHGFVLEGENYSTLDYPGAESTFAAGINDIGEIVGSYTDAAGQHGFKYSGGNFSGPINHNGLPTVLVDINNSGLIAGYAGQDAYTAESFISNGVESVNIRYPFWGDDIEETIILGINNLGQGAGYFFFADYYGFFYDGNTYYDVNYDSPSMTESLARDVNDNGVVLGTYFDGISGTFLLDGQGYSSVLFPGAQSTHGYSINNAGAIVGVYDYGRSFLALPSAQAVPEPSTFYLLGIAGMATAYYMRRSTL